MVTSSSDETSDSQVETLESHGVLRDDEAPRWVCLTILYHPDLERVGEQAVIGQLMAGKPVELSRKTPQFVPPGTNQARSLDDPYVSRSPVVIDRVSDDQIDITPSPGAYLHVDDRHIDSRLRVPTSALHEGVVLQLARRVIILLHTIALRDHTPRWGLVGESEGICQVRRQIAQVADLEVPVLIRGETGVGKESVAQAIHAASRRASKPCIAVNMAAIPTGTAASELFGHERGAFTGAIGKNVGLFERADGSTLFLDEIGETPTNIQAMLLRTLSEGTIMPVGSLTERKVDVRLIAATDARLEDGVADGSFRATLLHRLAGYEIRVPPLRERREDIPRLTVHFLEHELADIGETWRLMSRVMSRTLWFPPQLMMKLYRHDWPGNVRQLGNVVRQLVISSRGLAELRIDSSVARTLSEAPPGTRRGEARGTRPRKPNASREITDKDVYEALHTCNWEPVPAAEMLGIPRSTLYKLIEKHPDIRKGKELTREEIEEHLRSTGRDIDAMAQRLRVSRRALKLRMKELGLSPEERP